MLRLGIDATFAANGIRAGLFTHHYELLRVVRTMADLSVTLFMINRNLSQKAKEKCALELSQSFHGVPARVARLPGKCERLRLLMSPLGWLDVFYHVFGDDGKHVSAAANAYLIPDIIPLVLDYSLSGFREYASEYYKNAVSHGDVIFVYSEHTKRDVIERCGASEGQIVVTPLAAAPEFRPLDDRAAVDDYLNQLGIGGDPYVLAVGSLEPRKNLVTLVRAFARLKRASPRLRHRLVLSGAKWIGYEPVFEAIAAEGVENAVIHVGRAERLELLYNGASLFAFPSIYEGFGLPPLEAMACGVPVIASNATSIPEVVGDAGFLVNPMDDVEMCEGMRRILEDDALRQELRDKGLARSRAFTWHETAKRFVDGLQRAVAIHRSRRRLFGFTRGHKNVGSECFAMKL
jgi:glycosyltransferase involved in cell wall biosynthesis